MQAYSFAALDAQGKTLRGQLEAESKRSARQQIRDRGLTALSVDLSALCHEREVGTGRVGVGGRRKVRVAQLAAFTRQLSIVLKAGIPLEEALGAVARQIANGTLRSVVFGVRAGVLEGRTLAQSLKDYPNAFPGLYCATVAAGERSGHLDIVMDELADFTERSHANVQKTRLALVYPVLLLLMSVAIVAGLLVFVVPDIVEVYVSQDAALPLLTRMLIDSSQFLRDWGYLSLLCLLGLAMAIRALLARPALRLRWHRALLRAPGLGVLLAKYNAARFAATLSILTRGGVPLVEAIRIAGEVLGNACFSKQVAQAAQQVEEGVSLYRALDRNGQFPPLMLHMIASGEAAGELDTMLARVAQNQQQELDNLVSTTVALFEPAMLLLMGTLVLIIVVAILQPILSMNQLI